MKATLSVFWCVPVILRTPYGTMLDLPSHNYLNHVTRLKKVCVRVRVSKFRI